MNTFKKMMLVGLVSCGMSVGAHAAAAIDADVAKIVGKVWEHQKFAQALRDSYRDEVFPSGFCRTHSFDGGDELLIAMRDYFLRFKTDENSNPGHGKLMLVARVIDQLPELELGDMTVDASVAARIKHASGVAQ